MSLCQLRSMSPIHLQYLRNMGVTATLTASLVREGQLWGLIAAHHYSPRYLRCTVRAAADLLAEVASTRISAIENYAHAQVALMVRRLEQRLVEATSTEGEWRYALFRNPRTLLQPLDATGAVLFCEGEVLTTGETPSTPELRALLAWVQAEAGAAMRRSRARRWARPTRRWPASRPRPAACWRCACPTAARLPDVVPQGTAAQRPGPAIRPSRWWPTTRWSCRRGAAFAPGRRSCAARRCRGPAAERAGARHRRGAGGHHRAGARCGC
jgi:hypothetical protein